MPHVALSLNYVQQLQRSIQMLSIIKHDLRELELVEYDFGKSDLIQQQINRLISISGSLQDIANNPEKYLVIQK